MKDRKTEILALTWTIGLFGRLVILVLQALGLVRIEGLEHLRELILQDKGFLLIHRHPSMRETAIIPLLFAPWALLNWKRAPVVTPDKRNYYDPWWCAFLRPFAIAVPRGDREGVGKALLKMRKALKEGRPLVLAPEGGRTFKGEEFKFLLPDGCIRVTGKPEEGVDLSIPVIRRFQTGVRLLCANGTAVLPVWVYSTKWRTEITFGHPESVPDVVSKEEALEDLLLRTSRFAPDR